MGRVRGLADGAGVSWLPAYTHDVAQYLTDLIAGGAGLSTVRQAVSTIGAAHRAAGAASPTESELVRLTVARVSGRNRRAAVQAPALLDDGVEAILATARLPRERSRRGMESLGRAARRGVVDIALVLRDCGLRRAEAAALTWSDIERWDDGTDTLQNQRMRLTEAGVDAAHIHQDIITGTVMQRQTINDLLDALHPRDA